jgi:hypothetical protein
VAIRVHQNVQGLVNPETDINGDQHHFGDGPGSRHLDMEASLMDLGFDPSCETPLSGCDLCFKISTVSGTTGCAATVAVTRSERARRRHSLFAGLF